MYSAVISRSPFERIYSKLPLSEKMLNEAFERIISILRGLKRLCKGDIIKTSDGEERGFYLSKSLPNGLCEELEAFRGKIEKYLKANGESPYYPVLDELCSELRRFLAVSEYFDGHFLFYLEICGNDTALKIYCLDPSSVMDAIQNKAVSSVFFSATLTPREYFCDILGGSDNAQRLSLPSPFDPQKLCVAVADYLSLRYEDRKKNTQRYAAAIAASVSSRAGNYIVYFPSYELMQSVCDAFTKKYPGVDTIVQKRNMSQREKEEFIESFKDDKGVLRVGFCVLGGAFSEGVDLPGSRLIGTVIFGVGLPGLSNEKNIIRDYYELINGEGYDYAYTFPGMNNVLQAAGRVIRRDEDSGIVVLVDDRYANEKYRALFPEHWENVSYAGNAKSLAETIRRFWGKKL